MATKRHLDTVRATLLISTACPHCAGLLKILCQWVKQGDIDHLEVINASGMPQETVEQFGVRSVPWLRLGEFELQGAQSEGQLRHWLERVGTVQGTADYFAHLLASGALSKVTNMINMQPAHLSALVRLVADPQADMKVQLGVGAVLEQLAGSDTLLTIVDELGGLCGNSSAKVRADAAHYLSHTASPRAIPYLTPLLHDGDKDVREIADEALNAIKAGE